MKTIVVYQSETGFTKKHANWIAEKIGCESVPLKEISMASINEYDRIIFGGWIMGGTIAGLDKIKEVPDEKKVVFAVGLTGESKEFSDSLVTTNHLEKITFHYFQGGINFEQMGFFKKSMLKMMRSSISKKKIKTKQEEDMIIGLSKSSDYSDYNKIHSFVSELSIV